MEAYHDGLLCTQLSRHLSIQSIQILELMDRLVQVVTSSPRGLLRSAEVLLLKERMEHDVLLLGRNVRPPIFVLIAGIGRC